ncbi:MAG: M20 family metallopeptidase [Acidimicrobiales bacterium]
MSMDLAKAEQDRTIELRRAIHRQPELGLDLPKTQRLVLESLDGLDLEIQLGSDCSSVSATLDTGRPGPTVLLRGDMDALPMPEDSGVDFASEIENRMHACGHDSHVAMLSSAAHILHGMRHELVGRVRFYFQPGEEGFGGAKLGIEDGVLDGVDCAYALHIWPTKTAGTLSTRAGTMMASADEFYVRIVGKGGHASAPHTAKDPIPVGAAFIQALQTFVTREVPISDPAVVTVAHLQAGTTTNVIPEDALIDGTIRTLSPIIRAQVQEALPRIANGIAEAHGMTAETRFRIGYPPTLNHVDAVATAQEVCRDLVGADATITMRSPDMGAEDFSYILEQVPGAMLFLGVCPEGVDPNDAQGCHSNKMQLNEDSLAVGVAFHVAMARRFLATSDLPEWMS